MSKVTIHGDDGQPSQVAADTIEILYRAYRGVDFQRRYQENLAIPCVVASGCSTLHLDFTRRTRVAASVAAVA